MKFVEFMTKSAPPTTTESSTLTETKMPTLTPSKERPIKQTELSIAKGDNDEHPLYIGVKDPYGEKTFIFDVASGLAFYGPGSGYHLFAGRDATYGLSTSCLDPEKQDGDISTLTASQKDTHIQWYEKYSAKYPIVGFLVPDDYVEQGEGTSLESKKDA